MSPTAGVWLQDAAYLAACMALLDGCGGFIDFDIIKNDMSSLTFSTWRIILGPFCSNFVTS